MDAGRVLAFRLARSGLAARDAPGLAGAAACPASDFHRDAALLALAARADGVTRAGYDAAVDAGDVVVAHVIRGAIHAQAPGDLALWGRALLARGDEELGRQLGEQVRRLAAEKRFAPTDALEEVAEATSAALARGRRLGKNDLHAELRERVNPDLMPWCRSCGSHHVAPMLWRYATVKAGIRLDAERRYVLAAPGRAPRASEAVRRYLRVYGPSTPGDFAGWAGLAKPHALRIWGDVAADLEEVPVDGGAAWLLREDLAALESPPSAEGVRLIPPGDPYLQKPNRRLLAPDRDLHKQMFRTVAGPGVVLRDGRVAGLWRARGKGKRTAIEVAPLGRLRRADVEPEALRIADLRGSDALVLDILRSEDRK